MIITKIDTASASAVSTATKVIPTTNKPRLPHDFVRDHSYANHVTMILPLSSSAFMIFAVNYDVSPMRVHPVALYDRAGQPHRFTASGLIASTGSGFAYLVEPIRPLRCRRDVVDLAEFWVRRYLDVPPGPFLH
jgi:hypothetical protein